MGCDLKCRRGGLVVIGLGYGQLIFWFGGDHKENDGIDYNKWQYVKEKDLQQIRIQRIGPLVHGASGTRCLIHKNNLLFDYP